MNYVLFAKMDQVFAGGKKNLEKYLNKNAFK